MNQKQTLLCGTLLGFLGVATGAFGAHTLKDLLAANGRLETYELAVRYQCYHALALLLVGILAEKLGDVRWSSMMILSGVVLFSGSLYLFALTNMKTFVFVTPFGGALLLIGWGLLFFRVLKFYK